MMFGAPLEELTKQGWSPSMPMWRTWFEIRGLNVFDSFPAEHGKIGDSIVDNYLGIIRLVNIESTHSRIASQWGIVRFRCEFLNYLHWSQLIHDDHANYEQVTVLGWYLPHGRSYPTPPGSSNTSLTRPKPVLRCRFVKYHDIGLTCAAFHFTIFPLIFRVVGETPRSVRFPVWIPAERSRIFDRRIRESIRVQKGGSVRRQTAPLETSFPTPGERRISSVLDSTARNLAICKTLVV